MKSGVGRCPPDNEVLHSLGKEAPQTPAACQGETEERLTNLAKVPRKRATFNRSFCSRSHINSHCLSSSRVNACQAKTHIFWGGFNSWKGIRPAWSALIWWISSSWWLPLWSVIRQPTVRPRRAAEVRVSAQRPQLTRYRSHQEAKITEVKIEVYMPHFSFGLLRSWSWTEQKLSH